MDLELGGRLVIVTGGASGIGWACARGFAGEGCRVALWDQSARVKDVATTLAREFGGPALGLSVDVSDFAVVQEAVRQTEAALGPISHVVHAAALGSGKFGYPFTNLTPNDWPRVLQVNIMGMVHAAHAITPGMVARKAGTLVFLASVAGQIGSRPIRLTAQARQRTSTSRNAWQRILHRTEFASTWSVRAWCVRR